MPNDKSLFYLALVDGNQILINKKQIESAVNKSQTETHITMISGEKFIANLNYGDLMFHLLNFEHTPSSTE